MVLRLIDTLRIYDENFILTGGGPGRSSELVSLFIVKKALREWAGGFSAAAAVVYLVIDVLLVFLLIMIMTRGKGMLERS
jgi:ABC-type sugar transport system permease subunit